MILLPGYYYHDGSGTAAKTILERYKECKQEPQSQMKVQRPQVIKLCRAPASNSGNSSTGRATADDATIARQERSSSPEKPEYVIRELMQGGAGEAIGYTLQESNICLMFSFCLFSFPILKEL